MMGKLSSVSWSALVALATALSSVNGFAQDVAAELPATVVERLQQGILAKDAELAEADYLTRFAGFAALIDTTHDLAYMARITVSRGWRDMDETQHQRFVTAFRELSIATYATRFRDMAGAEFRINGQRDVSGGRVEVQTELVPAGETPVSLNYVLQQQEGGWRIINVLADGVSDLALKRSQYRQILRDDGFEALIAHLRTQTDQASRD